MRELTVKELIKEYSVKDILYKLKLKDKSYENSLSVIHVYSEYKVIWVDYKYHKTISGFYLSEYDLIILDKN